MKARFLLLLIISILVFSCTDTEKNKTSDNVKKTANIKYAKGFNIEYFDKYKLITLYNPWDKYSVYYKYKVFYNDVKTSSKNTELNFSVVEDKIVALSGSQIGFLDKLSLVDEVIGISKKQYIYNRTIIENINVNKTIELGDEASLDYERLFTMQPKIVFVTGWNKMNSSFDRIIATGIPIVYMLEWQEQNPLGRAEWIKYIAAFFNKENQADSLFAEVKRNYNAIKDKENNKEQKPTVLHGSLIGGTWYMPGGESYIANLYADAGAKYILDETKETGSIPLKFESVYTKAKDADFWFPMIDIKNVDELYAVENRYELFTSFKNKKIFLSNKRQNSLGGNDYWESGVANPDLILKDLHKIFHQDTLKTDDLYFFSKIY